MRIGTLLLAAAAALPLLPAPAAAQARDFESQIIECIRSLPTAEGRASAITIVKAVRSQNPDVIATLVDVLNNPNEASAVQREAQEALQAITGETFPSAKKWAEWWNADGIKKFGAVKPISLQIEAMEEALRGVKREQIELSGKVKDAQVMFQIVFIASLVVGLLFVAVMIAFGVMGGSRLKAMREAIRQGERYITAGEEVSKRFNGIVDDLEAKKTEILDFYRKLREEHQGEIERYAELLEQNMEHRMREEAMGLRKKAEKELEETLKQMRMS